MVGSKRFSFIVNPSWPQHVSLLSIAVAVSLGLIRVIFSDWTDPLHCNTLLNRGRWLDYKFANWQPDGCMAHSYKPADVATCLSSKEVVFIGDSVTRQLFFQFANIVDPNLPNTPPDDESKHKNHILLSNNQVSLSFYWDPYMNTSYTQHVHTSGNDRVVSSSTRPALLVLGTGLWYLRYSDSSGGLPAWASRVESVLGIIKHATPKLADEVVFLPIEEPVSSKLSPERAATIHPSDVDAMNSELYHQIYPSSQASVGAFSRNPSQLPVALPLVFNHMLDPSKTEDGLHFSSAVIKAQANLLLNLRCNDELPKHFPMDKTCCRSYPWPSPLHIFVYALLILWGPLLWLHAWWQGQNHSTVWIKDEQKPPLIISGAVALMYTADRTGFWLKEQKEFNPWTFSFLSLLSLAVGVFTVKRADKDLGFLNREQTDEWKGWMQIAILIYHYTGASRISGIYNPIRVLVAGYLFMTGYGHTVFYVKKADFGLLRVAQVMIRLNLLTVILAYVMNADYLFYYFAPLVSMWYLIIYATMVVGYKYNDRTPFLVCKILASMSLITWFMSESWLIEALFDILERTCAIHWSAKEWSFRFKLDLWIVYFGMFTALAFMKIREHRLTDHALWPVSVKVSIGISVLAMFWFFAFELWQPTKFTYNAWHPYISPIPVAAFFTLRNANKTLRSASSQVFAFIGRCSLETFIIQYHLWLAADTKGLLIVIPWTRWRLPNIIVTTAMFIYVSHQVSQATTIITAWICDSAKTAPTLPIHGTSSGTAGAGGGGTGEGRPEAIPLVAQDSMGKDEEMPREPDTPARPRRWVDRLAEGSSSGPALVAKEQWRPGVVGKVFIGLGVMWLLNVLWPAS